MWSLRLSCPRQGQQLRPASPASSARWCSGVGPMIRAERREPDAPVPDELGQRRPVVGQRDLGPGRTGGTRWYRQVGTQTAGEGTHSSRTHLPADGGSRSSAELLADPLVVTARWPRSTCPSEELPTRSAAPGRQIPQPSRCRQSQDGSRVRQHREHPGGGQSEVRWPSVLLVHRGLIGRGLHGSGGGDDGHREPPVGGDQPVAGLSTLATNGLDVIRHHRGKFGGRTHPNRVRGDAVPRAPPGLDSRLGPSPRPAGCLACLRVPDCPALAGSAARLPRAQTGPGVPAPHRLRRER